MCSPRFCTLRFVFEGIFPGFVYWKRSHMLGFVLFFFGYQFWAWSANPLFLTARNTCFLEFNAKITDSFEISWLGLGNSNNCYSPLRPGGEGVRTEKRSACVRAHVGSDRIYKGFFKLGKGISPLSNDFSGESSAKSSTESFSRALFFFLAHVSNAKLMMPSLECDLNTNTWEVQKRWIIKNSKGCLFRRHNWSNQLKINQSNSFWNAFFCHQEDCARLIKYKPDSIPYMTKHSFYKWIRLFNRQSDNPLRQLIDQSIGLS